MPPSSRFFALLLGVVLCSSAACGDDPKAEDTDGASGKVDAGDDEEEQVPCEAPYLPYREGMTAEAGDLTVRLVSVSPAPPRQQTPNNWMLEVVDKAGQPVSELEVNTPDSFMKVHNHHGRTLPKVVPQSVPGRVQLSAIDFKMRGPWWVTFNVVTGGKSAEAKFYICVE